MNLSSKDTAKNLSTLLLGTFIGGIFGLFFYSFFFPFFLRNGFGQIDVVLRCLFLGGGLLFGLVVSLAIILKIQLSHKNDIIAKNKNEIKAKEDFVSTMLHYVRTPLTGMLWSSKELFLDEGIPEPHKTQIKRLYEESRRILDTIEQLLRTSRASSGHVSYSFEDMSAKNLGELVADSISKMKPFAYGKNISVDMKMPPLSNQALMIDRDKFITVVQTLFENATSYTKEGGDIEVTMEEKDGGFLLHVSDSGIGIPQKECEKIFLQFSRGSNAQKEHSEGNGLGLFLAKTFITAHNGNITFKSKSKGTTFTVRIPFKPPV